MTRSRSPVSGRPGKSLVEIITVLVIVSTVMLFVGRVMVGVLRVESRTSVDTLAGRTLDRLGARLRADVRDARTVRAIEENGHSHGVHIERRTDFVEYTFEDGAIIRIAAEDPDEALDPHVDRYRLGGFDAKFEVGNRDVAL